MLALVANMIAALIRKRKHGHFKTGAQTGVLNIPTPHNTTLVVNCCVKIILAALDGRMLPALMWTTPEIPTRLNVRHIHMCAAYQKTIGIKTYGYRRR